MSTIMCIYIYIFLFLVSTFMEDIRTVNVLVETPHSWMDANNYCRDRFGGTLISREAVPNLNIDLSETESFWTLEHGTLSQWNDIIGCFNESALNTGGYNFIFQDHVIGRCSIYCFNHPFFGIKAGNHCTCFMSIPESAIQIDASNCNTSCIVKGRASKYFCGGHSFFTVFQKAPKTPELKSNICPYKTTCTCAVIECNDPKFYAQTCVLSMAASCGRGGFKYVRFESDPVFLSWVDMTDACASGKANAPSSYIDSLLAESDRNTHCNGNAQNPSVIWTSTFRSFVPDENETFDTEGGTMMCSYCIKIGTNFTCDVYYDTCDTQSPQFRLQSICSYEENSSLRSSTKSQTTEGLFTERNGTATESVTRRPFRRRPRRKREGNLAMIGGICGGVLAVIIVVIIIVVVVYRRRKKTYDKQTEQMLGGQNDSKKRSYSKSTSSGHGSSNLAASFDNTRNAANTEENMELHGPKDNSLSNRHELPGYMHGISSKASPNETYMPSENMYDHTNTHIHDVSIRQNTEGIGKWDETYDHANVEPYPSPNSDYYDHMGVHADTESMYGVSNDKARNDMSLREGDIYNHTSERDIHGGDMEPSVYYDHGMRSTENSEYDHLQHKKGNGETSRPRDEAENIYDESNL